MSEHPNNETFQGYLDDELTQPKRIQVEAHLSICSTCEAELAELRRLFYAIESIPSETLDADLAPAVMAAVQARTSWLPSIALGELLAAAALTLALVVWIGGVELQTRLGGAVQRLFGQVEVAAAGFSTTFSDFLTQVPESPQVDLFQLGDLMGSFFGSSSLLWAAGAIAFALLLLGNGLVLRTGKDSNV